jgi:hypothetical protein
MCIAVDHASAQHTYGITSAQFKVIDRTIVTMVRFIRSSKLWLSCAYGSDKSWIMPFVSKKGVISLFRYSPPLSVFSFLILAENCVSTEL